MRGGGGEMNFLLGFVQRKLDPELLAAHLMLWFPQIDQIFFYRNFCGLKSSFVNLQMFSGRVWMRSLPGATQRKMPTLDSRPLCMRNSSIGQISCMNNNEQVHAGSRQMLPVSCRKYSDTRRTCSSIFSSRSQENLRWNTPHVYAIMLSFACQLLLSQNNTDDNQVECGLGVGSQ